MSGARISGGDKFTAVLKRLEETKSAHVKAGVLADSPYSDGTSLVMVATINEFGGEISIKERKQDVYFKQGKDGTVGNRFVKKSKSNFSQEVTIGPHTIVIPARPFMRRAVAENVEKWKSRFQQLMKTKSVEEALATLGEVIVRDIQKSIKAVGAGGGNAKSTAKKKGFDKPLMDSGHLSKSISYEVVPGESE